jgi:type I restriction enzyme S subunit
MLRGSIEELQHEGRGNTFSEIPAKVVKEFVIPLPPVAVQQGIADFLDVLYRRLSGERLAFPELPGPLVEQRRIVARIEELATKIAEARSLRHQASEKGEALVDAGRTHVFSVTEHRVSIADVCTVIDPNPSHRYPMYVPHGIPIISSSEFVGEDSIDWSRARNVPEDFYQATLGRFYIDASDVIFSRKGKVGYARLHPPDVRLAMTHTLCILKPDQSKIEPRYLLHFTRSPTFLGALTGTMNPNLGVPTLGLGVIRDTEIPVPPRPE